MFFLKEAGANTSAPAARGAATLPACSRLLPLLLLAVLLTAAGAGCATSDSPAAEEPSASTDTLAMGDSLSALADTLAPDEAARYAFHGRDLEGKDGPMAKVGYDLARLYFAHRAHQRQKPGEPFEPPAGTPMRVADGRVTIDATAAEDADALRADLERLGLENGAAAGPLVSGQLPIDALPEAAALASLRSMRPAAAQTH